MDPRDTRELDVLDQEQCLALMRTATIGRVAFTHGALPAVQPVTFALGEEEVFIPTHPGNKVVAASRGAVVAFEVDDVDPAARTGWSVTVVGPSRVISEPAEVARLDRMGVRPWPRGRDRHCYIAITVSLVQGRRLRGSDDGTDDRSPRVDTPPGALSAAPTRS
jgi:hypothetical protein